MVDGWKREVAATGLEVIDFSMGNPDLDPPENITRALTKSLSIKGIHRYSKYDWDIEKKFRQAIAQWYYKKFGVEVDPSSEVLPLIGSKEGIAHLAVAFMNNDDLALIPSPAYPIHFNGVILAGGILYNIPLKEENHYLPDFDTISRESARLAKLMILSYPHNPTAATCDIEFFRKAVRWGKDKNFILCNDLAYSDFVYGKQRAVSLLEVKEARNFCIEFHTLSKSYSVPGWRVGFAVGNKTILATLAKTKSYVDFGMFRAVQAAATEALIGPQGYVKKIRNIYKKRIDTFVDGLNAIGWETPKPGATFYVWTKIPNPYRGLTSMEFTELLLRQTGVAVSPGTGFGEYGEGYVRFALVQDNPAMKRALGRIKSFLEIKI